MSDAYRRKRLVLHVQQNVVLNHELWLVVVLMIHLRATLALLAVALLQVKRTGRVQFVQFAARVGTTAGGGRVLAGVHQAVRCGAYGVCDCMATQIALSSKVLAALVTAVRLLVGVRK